MKVAICSRETIEKTNKYEFPENTVAISFYDPAPHYNSPNYKPVDYSKKVDKVLKKNLEERHIRGGMATKARYAREDQRISPKV